MKIQIFVMVFSFYTTALRKPKNAADNHQSPFGISIGFCSHAEQICEHRTEYIEYFGWFGISRPHAWPCVFEWILFGAPVTNMQNSWIILTRQSRAIHTAAVEREICANIFFFRILVGPYSIICIKLHHGPSPATLFVTSYINNGCMHAIFG